MNRMKIKHTAYFVAVLSLTLALAGCRTTRSAGGSTPALSKKQQRELLTPLAQYPAEVQAMTAKMVVTLDAGGGATTLKGRLRMRRDEVVQVSITAFGLMEVASIEFTPERAYIIDKVNKRYASLNYSSGWANLAGANFDAVQALFWNRLFIPGEKEVWKRVEDFSLVDEGTQRLVEPSRQRMLKCRFYTDMDCRQLQQTNLALQQYDATWRYDGFETIGSYIFPTAHDVSVSNSSHSMGVRVGLTDISTFDTGWKSGTDLARYKQVDLEQLLSILNMIM